VDVTIDGVAKTFGPKRVLSPFSLTLRPGRIHALLGQNGSGKSTLIKILTGIYQPDDHSQATVRVGGQELEFGSTKSSLGLGIRVVHQDLGLVGESSVIDNLSFGLGFPTRWGSIRGRSLREETRRYLEDMSLEGVDPTARVNELSAAQKTGVAIARSVRGGDTPISLLILDEPTATLPAKEVARLEQMLQHRAASGTSILYVTHHLDEVFRIADEVSVLRDGHLVLSAPVPDVTPDQVVEALVGSVVEPVRRESATEAARHTDVVLDVAGLEGPALNGVDLRVHAGELVGIYGLTGSGRESILGTIYGALDRDGGTVMVGGEVLAAGAPHAAVRAGVGYLPPDRKRGGGIMTMTAAENVTLPDVRAFFRAGFLRKREERAHAQEWLDTLDVRPADASAHALASFSGGNQQKVLMAKWIRMSPRLLLLDEPTQGVDVGAKASLHRHILSVSQSGTAVLVNSTDVEELTTLCDRVLILHGGRIVDQVSREELSVSELDRRLLASTTSKVM
jgi:ribose transport system ATP-binding protein